MIGAAGHKRIWRRIAQAALAGGVCLLPVAWAQAGLFEKGAVDGAGARALGMAGAYTALAGDENAVSWNPAGLGELNTFRVDSSLGTLYGGRLQSMDISLGYPLLAGTAVGFQWQHAFYPQAVQVNTDLMDFAGSLPLTADGRLLAGAGFKILLGGIRAPQGGFQGFGMDFGARYKYPLDSENRCLIFAACIQDLDTRITWANGTSEQIPQSVSVGTAFFYDAATVAALDLQSVHSGEGEGEDTRVMRLGLERWFTNLLAIRAGYLLDSRRTSTFTLGTGVRAYGWDLEYALVGSIADLGLSHQLSISYGLPPWPLAKPKAAGTGTMAAKSVLPPEPYAIDWKAQPAVFSPNGDGVDDTTAWRLQILRGDPAQVAHWRVTITDKKGGVQRNLAGLVFPQSVMWDGRNQRGEICRDGVYIAALALDNARGQRLAEAAAPVTAVTAMPSVLVEAVPSELVMIGAKPLGRQSFKTLGGETLAGITWKLSVRNAKGETVRTFAGERTLPPDISWTGTTAKSKPLPEGDYTAEMTVHGAAGLSSSSAVPIRITRVEPKVKFEAGPRIIKLGSAEDSQTTFTLTAEPGPRVRSWELTIAEEESGNIVRTFAGTNAPPAAIRWDAKTQDGRMVKNGQYFRCRFKAVFTGDKTVNAAPLMVATDVNNLDAGKALSLHLMAVPFARASSAIPLEAFASLKQSVETVKRYAKRYRLQIKGNTDNEEAPGNEFALSRERAQKVAEYLTVAGGIPSSTMDVIGYGTADSMTTDNTPAGRAKNRRVEVVLIIQK